MAIATEPVGSLPRPAKLQAAIEAGCDHFISKPIGDDFEQRVADILASGPVHHARAGGALDARAGDAALPRRAGD